MGAPGRGGSHGEDGGEIPSDDVLAADALILESPVHMGSRTGGLNGLSIKYAASSCPRTRLYIPRGFCSGGHTAALTEDLQPIGGVPDERLEASRNHGANVALVAAAIKEKTLLVA